MPTHAAFLRAVNLGSRRKASGAQLKAALESAGFEDVASFRLSGNVVFSASDAAAKIRAAAEAALEAELGFDVPVFLRTKKQLESISSAKPFPAAAHERAAGPLQVVLLHREPKAAGVETVLALANDDDLLEVDRTEMYWLPAHGTQGTRLNMAAIDKALGQMTVRTQGTISRLYEKFF
jgi:uncharacterized protein (DUF1697 family)